jgi:dipeptidyl aminopeptidase/acylaminoacyl peptidase
MSYFGTTRSSQPNEMDDDGIISPDGRYVVKVTHRGLLPEGLTEGTIWLFDASTIERSLRNPKIGVPVPIVLARMSAVVNGLFNGLDVYDAGNTVFQLQWADDSQSLTFLGRNGRNNRQLFRIAVATRDIHPLTPDTQDAIIYARSGSGFTYFAGADADLQIQQAWWSTGPGIPDIAVGTGVPLMPLLYPHFNGEAFSEPVGLEVWQAQDDHDAPVFDQKTHKGLRITTRYDAVVLSSSPDATQLATIGYDDASGSVDQHAGDAETHQGPLRYQIIDVVKGAKTPLVSAPIVGAAWRRTGRYRAAWSADGTQIALSETEVPSKHPTTPDTRGQRCTVALVNLSSRAVDCIVQPTNGAEDLIESLHWQSGDELLARYKKFDTYDYRTETLQRRGHSWITLKSSKAASQSAFQLTVRESLNEPPTLVATDPAIGKSRPIFDPNPQLANISLGSVSVYEWKDAHGRIIKGGLVKPPDYVPGRRYPLVIQTHGFDAKRFFSVGFSNTANAGRALAARDLIVLQVHEPSSDTESWRDAMDNGTEVYLAAIDQLAAEGIIDSKKVGISGYSYSGWLAATSITRAPDRFAAAEIANTDPVTLMGYFTHVDSPVGKVEAQAYVGAKPYGAGLNVWAERAPGLATDKITAPVLFQAADPWHLLSFWEMYAGMRDQGKPVELQYIRGGQHIVKKPLHQVAHQETLVDWFDFWLNGHEDPDSTKSSQYARWRTLKQLPAIPENAVVQ